MMKATWVQSVRSVQMVPLFHLIKHPELKLKIARPVPKVKIKQSVKVTLQLNSQGYDFTTENLIFRQI